ARHACSGIGPRCRSRRGRALARRTGARGIGPGRPRRRLVVGPAAGRPSPVRPADHADPGSGPRPDLLGSLRAADRGRVPEVVPEAAALERRIPVREVLAGGGRAAGAGDGAAGRDAGPRCPRPRDRAVARHRRPAPRGVGELALDRRPDPGHERPAEPGRGASHPIRGSPRRARSDGARGGAGRHVNVRSVFLVALIAAAVLTPLAAVLPAGVPGAAQDVAAASGLTTTADARYVVDPTTHRVHVSVALKATNGLKDTKTHRYFFDRSFMAVPPGTANFKIV